MANSRVGVYLERTRLLCRGGAPMFGAQIGAQIGAQKGP
jgi:hypothetical protein